MAGNVSYYKIILFVTLSKKEKYCKMKTISNYEKFEKVIRIC